MQHIATIDNLFGMTDRKLESVFVRLSIKERKELEKRAKALDRKLAEFVRLAALKVAREGLDTRAASRTRERDGRMSTQGSVICSLAMPDLSRYCQTVPAHLPSLPLTRANGRKS
jgi:uncharacterized protein (DUF1778 family)